MKSLFNVMKRK